MKLFLFAAIAILLSCNVAPTNAEDLPRCSDDQIVLKVKAYFSKVDLRSANAEDIRKISRFGTLNNIAEDYDYGKSRGCTATISATQNDKYSIQITYELQRLERHGRDDGYKLEISSTYPLLILFESDYANKFRLQMGEPSADRKAQKQEDQERKDDFEANWYLRLMESFVVALDNRRHISSQKPLTNGTDPLDYFSSEIRDNPEIKHFVQLAFGNRFGYCDYPHGWMRVNDLEYQVAIGLPPEYSYTPPWNRFKSLTCYANGTVSGDVWILTIQKQAEKAYITMLGKSSELNSNSKPRRQTLVGCGDTRVVTQIADRLQNRSEGGKYAVFLYDVVEHDKTEKSRLCTANVSGKDKAAVVEYTITLNPDDGSQRVVLGKILDPN